MSAVAALWMLGPVAIIEWVLVVVMLPGYLRDRRRAAGLRPPPLPGERITPETWDRQ